MKKILSALIFVLAISAPAYAQVGGIVVQPGEAYRLAWDYVTTDMAARPVQFRLYVDDVVVHNFTSGEIVSSVGNLTTTLTTFTTNAGVITPFTIAQAGAHKLSITAYDASSESGKLDLPITVVFTAPPTTPTNIRVIKIQVSLNQTTGEIKLSLIPDAAAVVKAKPGKGK